MSLLNHLVRATLAPEQAARPALPQQFANWGGSVSADDGEWGEESDVTVGPLPAQRADPIRDDPFAPQPHPAAPGPHPDAVNLAPASRPPLPELPEAEARPSSPHPARVAEPLAEVPAAMPALPRRSAPRQPEHLAAATLPLIRPAEHEAPVGRPAPPPAETARARPAPPVADTVVTIPVAVAPQHAVATVGEQPAAAASRPGRHNPPAPARTETPPAAATVEARPIARGDAGKPLSAPEMRRDPPRLAEPRVVAPVLRQAAPDPLPQPATPLIVPLAAPQPAVVPVLAAPQVILPEPAAAQPQLPDVHISIGRVEVRAAATPPRPVQREASGKAEPLSLDAYLTRRNGSR